MKTTKLFLAAIMSIFFTIGMSAQPRTHYVINHHYGPEKRIEKKIKHGIRSWELTKWEVKDLKREYRKIERIKRDAWRNGHINRHERRRIERATFAFDRLLDSYLHNRRDRYERHHNHQRYDRYYDEHWNWYNDEYDYYYKGNKSRKYRGY